LAEDFLDFLDLLDLDFLDFLEFLRLLLDLVPVETSKIDSSVDDCSVVEISVDSDNSLSSIILRREVETF